ncbi:MAG: hypothetical protein JW749_10420 [Sedimentisphaerales bacterium]|nr:hypothetical protein [Sedimentisphaerales bacterium]
MMKSIRAVILFIGVLGSSRIVGAGPYNEPGVSGYVGSDGKYASPGEPNAVINPIFRGWATSVASYEPTPQYMRPWWAYPTKALGPTMSDTDEVYTVSLGDLYQEDIDAGVPTGRITLSFSETIQNQKGYDFVVFENGFRVSENECYGELGYVEVSTNDVDFARFPAVALMTPALDPNMQWYYFFSITDVYNLAGKHPNNGNEELIGEFTGTPFDLDDIKNDPNVLSGLVDINNITYVRIIDIPGSGDFNDEGQKHIDPCTWPDWDYYDANHPIYDAWPTYESGGLDLEAIGVLHPQQYRGDINLDGIVNYEDFVIFANAWRSQFGQAAWFSRCDINSPKDMVVDFLDFAVFAEEWLMIEQWRINQ